MTPEPSPPLRARRPWLQIGLAATALAWSCGPAARAQNTSATWNVDANGNWTTTTNWAGGAYAAGADNTATFGANFTANRTVTVDTPITIGNLTLNDTTDSHAVILSSATNVLTLETTTGTPTITNSDVYAADNRELRFGVRLGGNQGVVKAGVGVVNYGIAGSYGGTNAAQQNTYTGTTTISQGGIRNFMQNGLGTAVVVESGATLWLDGGAASNNLAYTAVPLTISGTGVGSNNMLGALYSQPNNTLTWQGKVTLAANATIHRVSNGGTLTFDVASGDAIDTAGFTLTMNANHSGGTDSMIVKDPIGGSGALVQAGNAVLVLEATNTYAGATTVNSGRLRADDGVGLPTTSFLTLNTGVWETAANISRGVGASGSGTLSITGNSAGFSAVGGPVAVNLAGGATLAWGSTAGFFASGGTLTLQAATADSALTFQNPINLNGATRTVAVNANVAELTGAITNSTGTAGFTKSGAGLLVLSGTNTYNGETTISGGMLRGTVGSSIPSAPALTLSGGTLETSGTLARDGGSGGGQMRITAGTTGFSARGGDLTVTFGASTPAALTWGTAPFQPGTLVLNDANATHAVEFTNPINLGNAARTVQVDANAATLSGNLSGTGGGITKTGIGRLDLGGVLSYTGTTTISGSAGMLVMSGTSSATLGQLAVRNDSDSSGTGTGEGWLQISPGADYTVTTVHVNPSGNNVAPVIQIRGGRLTTTGEFRVGSSNNGTNDLHTASYGFVAGGTLAVGGNLAVLAGAGAGVAYPAFFTQGGGAITVGGDVQIAHSGGTGSGAKRLTTSAGTLTATGGLTIKPVTTSANAYDLVVGGGTTTINSSATGVQLGADSNSGNGRVFVAGGGVLAAHKVIKNSTTTVSANYNTLFFNDGTIRALADNADFLGPLATPASGNTALGNNAANAVFVYSGGVTVDSNGFTVTINPALVPRSAASLSSLGSVTGITAGNAGANYAVPPTVSFTGGGGSGATAYATLDATGGIAAIVITDPGTGYTTAPAVTLSGGTLLAGSGVAATPGSWNVNLRDSTAGGLTKTGAGTVTLARGASYTGPTAINQGTLVVAGANTGGGVYTVNSGGRLAGAGSIASTLSILSGGTISPGNSPGTFSAGATTLAAGGNYLLEVNNAFGEPGLDPGWDLLAVNGVVDLTGVTASSRFNVLLTSLTSGNVAGQTPGFDPALSYAWLFVDSTAAITSYTGFDQFNVDTAGFANPFTQTFRVLRGDLVTDVPGVTGADDTQLYVVYTVPEPAILATLLPGLAAGWLLLRQRRRARPRAGAA